MDPGRFFYRRPAGGVEVGNELQAELQVGGRSLLEILFHRFQGVDILPQLPHGEHLVVIFEGAVIRLVQFEGGKVQHFLVIFKAHADKFRIGRHPITLPFLVDPSILQDELQGFFVGGDYHFPFLRYDDIILVARNVLFIDHYAADGGIIFFFFPDLDDVSLDLVIEDPFLDIESGLGDDDIIFEGIHLQVGYRDDIVIEKEGDITDDEADDEKRAHEAEQGDAGGFDGDELEGLTQVAEGHDRRQQHRQGQGQGHQGSSYIHDQRGDGEHIHAFPHDIVDIEPEELPYDYEEGDKELSDKGPDKGLQNEDIQFFKQALQHGW